MSGKPQRKGGKGQAKEGKKPSPLGQSSGSPPVRDGEIIENETVTKNNTIIYGTAALKKQTVLPPRPGYTSLGQTVQLLVNCFPIELIGKPQLYQYGVVVERKDEPDDLDHDSELVKETENLNLEPRHANDGQAPCDNQEEDKHPKGAKLAQILYHFFNRHPELRAMMDNGEMGSDFSGTVISTTELGKDWVKATGTDIVYRGQKSKYKKDQYTVFLKPPKVITAEDTIGYLDGSEQQLSWESVNRSAEMIQALNIMYRNSTKWKAMALDVSDEPTKAIIGSKTYSLGGPKDELSTGVVAIPGFFSSIRPAAGRLLMNVNNTCGPFHEDLTLTALKQAMCPEDKNLRKLQEFSQFIRGVTVRLSHRNEHDSDKKPVRALKTIRGLADKTDGVVGRDSQGKEMGTPLEHPPRLKGKDSGGLTFGARCGQIEFWEREKEPEGASGTEKPKGSRKSGRARKEKGKYVTVHEYFKKKYPASATRADDFAINVGTQSRPEYVPMSVCKIIPGQSYRATLTSDQVSRMITIARKEPDKNVDDILNKTAKVLDFKSKVLRIKTDQLLTVQGQLLTPPAVVYGGDKPSVRKGGWNLAAVKGYTMPGSLPKWAVMVVTNNREYDRKKVKSSVDIRQQKIQNRGIAARGNEQPGLADPVEIDRGNFQSTEALRSALEHADYRVIKLWFVYVPERFSSEEYKCLKRVCDVELGVHTCCINTKKSLDDPQYWDNVLLKVNLKLGGVNQTISLPEDKIIDFSKIMVVGLDVTHPAPGAQATEQSVAAMVASCDKHFGQWPATMIRQQQSKEEVISSRDAIFTLLKPHLDRWKLKHKGHPQSILIYRDGVSEGQYQQVVDKEYEHLKWACTKAGGIIYKPKITIVVVGKRHHMRFFNKGPDGKALEERTLPGTLVDRGVTSQYLWEFYLQAHNPLKGTARPAHYVVLVDQIFSKINRETIKAYSLDHAQNLLAKVTNALSYVMGRSTTAVSVCAPAFLADKACDRARAYNMDDPKVHTLFKDKMFYI
ncbi:Ribonuclease H-like domain containing protein [Naviculisporaceae sp. PSN 640]